MTLRRWLTVLFVLAVGVLSLSPLFPGAPSPEDSNAARDDAGRHEGAPALDPGAPLRRWGRAAVDAAARLRRLAYRARARLAERLGFALGWREFTGEVPEDICYRDYPYIRAVEEAGRKRWFAPGERNAYVAAQAALQATREHRVRLIEDRTFRAGDAIRALVGNDPKLKDYVYASRWEPPFLICYSSAERIRDRELLFVADEPESRSQRARLRAEQERLGRRLEGKAKLVRQLYAEFLRRFAKPLGLTDLNAEFGGRPDLPAGVRSFQDGVPLVIWIFEDEESFDRHQVKEKMGPVDPGMRGYFDPRTGFVTTHDVGESPAERTYEIYTLLGCVTHQLAHWFSRQRNRWRKPHWPHWFFGQGLSRWMSAVTVSDDWQLRFTGLNLVQLARLQQSAEMLEKLGHADALFPLETLVGVTSSWDAARYGRKHWDASAPLSFSMFTQQSWALVLFLHEFDGGRYEPAFLRLFELALDAESSQDGAKMFAEALRLRSPEDLARVEKEFHGFVREDLMKRDMRQYFWVPPARPR